MTNVASSNHKLSAMKPFAVSADFDSFQTASIEGNQRSQPASLPHGSARYLFPIVCATAVTLLAARSATAATYTQNFGPDTVGDTGSDLGDGSFIVSNPAGTAQVISDPGPGWTGLRLTAEGVGSSQAAYYIPDLNPGQPITSFTANFESLIYTAGGTPAADAWAFNFGNITDTSTAYVGAGSGMQVAGKATDVLTVSFITYNTNQIQVWYNGSQIGGSYGTPRIYTDTFVDKFQATAISWDKDTGLSLSYGGSSLITNLSISGFTPAAGYRFGFNGWTGTHAETVALRNLSIQTVPEPSSLLLLAAAAVPAGAVVLRRRRSRNRAIADGGGSR
jgi:hypothetical protein